MKNQKVVLIGQSGQVNENLSHYLDISSFPISSRPEVEQISFRNAILDHDSVPRGADVYVIGGRMGAYREAIDELSYNIEMDNNDRPVAIIDLSPTHRDECNWTRVVSRSELVDVVNDRNDVLRLTQPGCIATAGIIALRPLMQQGLIESTTSLYLDVTTGTSTGGVELQKRFAEEDITQSNHSLESPHQHVGEIRRVLGMTNNIVMMPKVVNRERNINLFVHVPDVSFSDVDDAFVSPENDIDRVRLQPLVPIKKLFGQMSFLTAYCAYWPSPSGDGVIVQVVMDNIMRGSVLPAIDLIQASLRNVSSR